MNIRRKKTHLSLACITLVGTARAQNYQAAYTSWGDPDLQGNWKHATVMPFERPRALGDKRTYTEEEVLVLEQAAQQRFEDNNQPLDPDRPPPEITSSLPPIGTRFVLA